ncbi:cell division topological specificity factor MinE [Armatimonas sp.]|uniref:cell division topological specificity factor MinE n=1 Tax=Armatimonas sp. TaxID=1872638 RepID=UPI00286BA3E3|nr:cell division topological specificity factor MinE [Armatimonas sp.]
MTLLDRIFGRHEDSSKSVAKDRLKNILMHDRADIPPHIMEKMRMEIIAVIAKYIEINDNDLKVDLERADSEVALVANIPIRRIKG